MAITFSTPQEEMLFDLPDFSHDPWNLIYDPSDDLKNIYGLKFVIVKTNINVLLSAFIMLRQV